MNQFSNTIWGLNGAYSTDSRFLTKMVDKLPFIQTKEKSTFSVVGEFAHFIPGHPKSINIDETGTSYVDDLKTLNQLLILDLHLLGIYQVLLLVILDLTDILQKVY